MLDDEQTKGLSQGECCGDLSLGFWNAAWPVQCLPSALFLQSFAIPLAQVHCLEVTIGKLMSL